MGNGNLRARMSKLSLGHAVYRVALAAWILQAQWQSFSDALTTHFGLVNHFSYFTNESNLMAAAVLLICAFTGNRQGAFLSWCRGGVAVYMAVTFIVAEFLLGGGFTLLVPHIIGPIGFVLDWFVFPPQQKVSGRASAAWIAFPLVFLVYTLVRGALVGWYPYTILDPAQVGSGGVAKYVVAISLVVLLLSRVVRMTQSGGRTP